MSMLDRARTGFGISIVLLVAFAAGYDATHPQRSAAEPSPPPAECRLLATIPEARVDLYRCTGAGFDRSCYISVTREGMAAHTTSLSCGGP